MTIHGWNEFKWLHSHGEWYLLFNENEVARLIKHENIENHYHILFDWRKDKTPEFFNITNAKDNARSICLAKVNNNIKKHVQEARG